MSKSNSFLIVFSSIIISFFTSLSGEIDGGMGGLVNFFSPVFSGILSLLLLFILWGIPKSKCGKITLTALISIYNLHVGIFLHYDWPSPFLIY